MSQAHPPSYDDNGMPRTQKMKTVSAPGKLVLAGEYAVLEGNAAWVTAVNRRAVVHFNLGIQKKCENSPLRVSSHNHGEQDLGDDVDNGYFDLLRCVLHEVSEKLGVFFSGRVHVDTSAMEADDKLGIGSSAAVAVAFTYALLLAQSDPDDEDKPDSLPSHHDVHALAHASHLAFSGGRGSGVDVAAAVYGGSISFQRSSKTNFPIVTTAPLDVDGLEVLIVYSGHSQNTRSFVAKVELLKKDGGDSSRNYQELMFQLASAAKRAMTATSTGELLPAIHAANKAMAALGKASGADIVSTPHQQIADIAAHHCGAAKPSGAGGGDVALAFFAAKHAQAARETFTAQGFSIVEMQLGAPGVK